MDPSVLTILVQAGLSSFKSPACYQLESKNHNCPACAPFLSEFASTLPFSHHESSYLVCRLSGDIMDENNYPMVLPNGQLYSKNALMKMADENNGIIHCLKTGFSCPFSHLKKAFIL
jgi:macrophage erythroblast attacher